MDSTPTHNISIGICYIIFTYINAFGLKTSYFRVHEKQNMSPTKSVLSIFECFEPETKILKFIRVIFICEIQNNLHTDKLIPGSC